VSFGTGNDYKEDGGVTLTFYFNHFHVFFTTRKFRQQEIEGLEGKRSYLILLLKEVKEGLGEWFKQESACLASMML
jgi:hypothetical protein